MVKTYGSVLADAESLTRRWVRVVKQIVRDIGKVESQRPADTSKKERAKSRWQIFLGLSIAQTGAAVATLAKAGNARSMVILTRSMFEFQQKAKYFLTSTNEASEQLESNFARRYSRLAKLEHPNPDISIALAADYLEWKRDNPDITEFSGNINFLRMHLANAKKKQIKSDRNGKEYTAEYIASYGVPSDYAHGEPPLLGEVFADLTNDLNWELREDHTILGTLEAINLAILHLSNYAMQTTAAYGLSTGRLNDIVPQGRRVQQGMIALSNFS